MKIAQVSPLFESVPPNLYGGTERVVSYLTEELVNAGHKVTLFASGDSVTSAALVPCSERALRLDARQLDPVSLHLIMMEEVLKRQFDFDIIHSHVDCIGFVLGRRTEVPVVSTLHGRLDCVEHGFIFREYAESPVISISDAQRSPQSAANWIGTVYHGVPPGLYRFNPEGGGYLVYVGRVSPEKRVDSAIRIAKLSGIPIKIAAKVDKADRDYFESSIKPLLRHPLVEFIGEVNDREKEALLGSALAFLHPVDWPEPFGLSMLEAMACGTPVLARRRGSIPEVVDHEVTGFIFESDEEAASLLKSSVSALPRLGVRKRFEKRFLATTMASNYLKTYEAVLDNGSGTWLRSAG